MPLARTLKLGAGSAIVALALLIPGAAASAAPPFPSGVIIGTPHADTLVGTGRSESIFGLGGDDHLYGRDGADRIFGGLGEDWIDGGQGPDLLRGGPGPDHIAGGPGNDLVLAAGDDTADEIRCGDGQDVAIVDVTDQVANDCEFVWARDPDSSDAADPPAFPAGVIVGTPHADTLVGTWRSEIIFALGGDDQVSGRAGADRIFGGARDDVMRGGPGPDSLFGGPGTDHIAGGPGDDFIFAAGDGTADVIDCGDGRQDLAIVDPSDEVANDCEFVWQRNPDN
jgi:Ca2+-binding RTX toxin-like protein